MSRAKAKAVCLRRFKGAKIGIANYCFIPIGKKEPSLAQMIVGVIPEETGFSHCEEIITLFFRIRLSAKAARRIFGHQFTKVVESIILIIILL